MLVADNAEILGFLVLVAVFALGMFLIAASPNDGIGAVPAAIAKRDLQAAIAPTRLKRMLDFRGVDLGDFVQHRTPEQLDGAMARCRVCRGASRCEAVLRGHLDEKEFAFCASRDLIEQTIAETRVEASSLAGTRSAA